MQQFTTTLFCIAMLLINSISVTAHTFEEVGFHAHTYTQSVKEYTINNHSGEESLQSCYCPDCFYSDNSNSNVSLAIVALSPWLMPVTIESDNFFEVFVTLKRSIPPDDRPPIAFLLHT
ncbi:hypothetical protein Glaag_4512 (plasmid) [Glaciecola sp. 4H-3-7+YE-5]|uniref:hypothetical protein n=1 Tax=Alteromonas sp. R78001 TaxID=3093865 RepID=UPI00020A67E4|nr:hypothetical protein Glaag_4512 [Glaciecola sp. 4H-3-7+YE-5]